MKEPFLTPKEKKSIWSFLYKKELEFWNERYRKKKKYYGEHPSWLAKQAVKYFKKAGVKKILEFACGQGRDAFYFAEKGFEVLATDVSEVAVNDIQLEAKKRGLDKKLRPYPFSLTGQVKAEVLDVRDDFPHIKSSFDACFSNLGLHYFPEDELKNILSKIAKVLKPKGYFIFSVNCIHDAYYGQGRLLSDQFFERDGRLRYFFSEGALRVFLEKDFKVLRLEEKEEIIDLFLKRIQSYFAVFTQKK